MDAIYTLLSRFRAVFRHRAAERELHDELRFHIELETEKNIREGFSPREARRHALISFGAAESYKEMLRDRRSVRWLHDAHADTRYALRCLSRSRGFTIVAVLTLGLGIGATTAIFAVVNAVLLRPLPYRDSGELAIIYAQNPERGRKGSNISYPDYQTWKQELQSFEGLAVFNWVTSTISGDDAQAERVAGAEVDADLFRVLGVEPLLGRGVRPEEQVVGRDRVIVLGYGLWQRRYGGDGGVLGRSINVDGQPHVIIGVMPPGFRFPNSRELWLPMAPDESYAARSSRFLAGAVSRLRKGVTREQAEAELARVSGRLQRDFPESNTGWEGQYVALRDDLVGTLRPAILIVFAAAGLVLLIACGNLASLLLARGAGRAREIALRAAIGAGRGRLMRQFLTETIVLTLLGGLLGLVVAYWGGGLLRGVLADRIPAVIHITPDLRVFAFAVAATALIAVLAGVAPALQGTGVNVQAVMKVGGRTTAGPRGTRARRVLVIAEVALAVVLLIGSALLIRSMGALSRIEAGFEPRNVLTARYELPESTYDSPERRLIFQAALFEQLRALPGVLQVGAAAGMPFSGWNAKSSYEVEGEGVAATGNEPSTHHQRVTPEFFEVLGIPLVRGRMLAATDGPDAAPVAVVNESFVKRHFQDQDPIGKRFRFGGDRPWIAIVGVVADYRHYRLTEPMSAAVFRPYAQAPRSRMDLAIRTDGSTAEMIPSFRRVMAELDADVPPGRVETLEEVISQETWVQRIARDIVTAFAGAAMLLTMIGLYGVIAYSVARERHEIAIRLALGEAPRRVLRLVLRRGLSLALTGIALGWTAALLATRWLRQLLFEVEPVDVTTFVLVPLVIAALAMIATWIPARRAATTDPMIALQAE